MLFIFSLLTAGIAAFNAFELGNAPLGFLAILFGFAGFYLAGIKSNLAYGAARKRRRYELGSLGLLLSDSEIYEEHDGSKLVPTKDDCMQVPAIFTHLQLYLIACNVILIVAIEAL